MRNILATILFTALLVSTARAQLTLPPMPSLPSIKVDVGNATDSGSAAEADEGLRDPFWPVGYLPAAQIVIPVEKVEKPDELKDGDKKKVALDMKKLSAEEQAAVKAKMRTGGFMTQGKVRFAIINNQIVAPGEVFKLKHKGKSYAFKVREIKGSTIVLEPNWNSQK